MGRIVLNKRLISEVVSRVVARVLSEGSYKTYNVNMKYPISKPHRTVKKLSSDELKDKLTQLWNKCHEDRDSGEEAPNDIKKLFAQLVTSARYGKNPKLKQFNEDCDKVNFDWENYDYVGDVRDYKGVKYMLYDIGGDWERPVAVFVYFDGDTLRAYVPIHGNAINLNGGKKRNEKVAFGNDDDADMEFCKKEGLCDGVSARDYVVYNKDAVIKDFHSALKIK